jgi:rubrerythrin
MYEISHKSIYDNISKNVDMYMVEIDMDLFWVCDECQSEFHIIEEFENKKSCPSCNGKIENFHHLHDNNYEDDLNGFCSTDINKL